jgi:hypothetical protein
MPDVAAQEIELLVKRKYHLRELTDYVTEYNVLKANKQIKHGAYTKYKSFVDLILFQETGSYKMGQKDGVWENYYSIAVNAIKSRGSFVNGKKNGVWTYYHRDSIRESNYFDISNPKDSKDSTGVIIKQTSKLMLAGMYLNDKRVGLWTTLDRSGGVHQKYDFSSQLLIKDESIRKDSSMFNVNRKPVYLGGEYALAAMLIDADSITSALLYHKPVKGDSAAVLITLKITAGGKVTGIRAESYKAPKFLIKESNRLAVLTEGNWIPALQNSKPVDSERKILFAVKATKGKERFDRIYWLSATLP